MSHLVKLDDAANVLQGRLQMANTTAAEAPLLPSSQGRAK